ncbi:TRAF-like protein [Pseudocohnilembus persalinus]|uniref:TRAF-like protein n=1 Tax=Pseudocohnilembus persalinus TaxID=266149 RepID=A0A0V0QXP3_PSEPJ|nr:TRAF-like protein [Pseudocohnilembus persalinus]|eukprot:KRX06994.1 TRAF-like protein [Pseudocohnilembus persalinus]
MQCHKCESLVCGQCFNSLNKNNYICKLEENCNNKNLPQMPQNWQKNDIMNKISQILIKCASSLNQDQEDQCGNVLHFSNYENHCKNCDLIKIDCQNQGCRQQLLKKDTEQHANQCQYEQEQCEFCGQKNVRKDLKIHEKVCKQRTQCQICQEYIGIQRIDQHKQICEQAKKNLNASNQMINFMIMQLKELNENVLQEKFVSTMQILSEFMKQQEEKQEQLFQEINKNQNEKLEQINQLDKEILDLQYKNTSFKKENMALEQAIVRECQLKQEQLSDQSQNNQLNSSDYSDSQLRVQDPFQGKRENLDEKNIIINKLFEQYEQTRKQQRQLKKICLKEANQKCESPNYWTDWKKFTKQCGELINEQQQQKFHDPLGFMFSNQCYNCYQIYQRYKEEEKRQGYGETLENIKQQIENLGGDLKDLLQKSKQKQINSSSYSQLNQSIKQ